MSSTISSADILTGSIGSILRRMTAPMVIGILAVILFQTVDTYFIGLLGTTELAAISFTFPVTFTLTSLVIGLGIGTSVLLAQVIGRGDTSTAQRIATDSILLACLLVAALALLGVATLEPLFRLLGATDNTLPYIRDYMLIWYASVGLLVVPMVGNAAIRATGDTKWPSLLMLGSGLMNAVIDPLLIFGLGPFPALGVQGAAISSAISWLGGLLGALYLLRVREQLLVFHLPAWAELKAFWGALLKVALPISAANMLTPICAAILTALIARFGEDAVAAFGAGTRMEAIAMVVIFALTSALSPYMAQNLGAGNGARARQALRLALRFALLFQLAVYVLVITASPWLARLFSQEAAVQTMIQQYLCIALLGSVFYGLMIIINTAFNAASQSRITLSLTLLRVFLCVAPCAWLGGQLYAYPGLLTGIALGNVLACLIAWRQLQRSFNPTSCAETQASQRDDTLL
ncbi:MAG: MATE family efflux transporter [Gammaproteobacteria bacterium]|nr:MAG: MATE family efflux transporter [Gammaproteobacteria bacterium]